MLNSKRHRQQRCSWRDARWLVHTVVVASLLVAARPGDAQSGSRQAVTVQPVNVQSSIGPSVHTIESSNLDADFTPGERQPTRLPSWTKSTHPTRAIWIPWALIGRSIFS
jgi:hypothetical protein